MLLCVYLVYVYITFWFETYYHRCSPLEKIGKNNKVRRKEKKIQTMFKGAKYTNNNKRSTAEWKLRCCLLQLKTELKQWESSVFFIDIKIDGKRCKCKNAVQINEMNLKRPLQISSNLKMKQQISLCNNQMFVRVVQKLPNGARIKTNKRRSAKDKRNKMVKWKIGFWCTTYTRSILIKWNPIRNSSAPQIKST